MKFNPHPCFSRLVVVLLALCVCSSCSFSLKPPSLKIPKLFGAKDKPDTDEKKDALDDNINVPANREVGVVHLVNDRGHFVLVKSLGGARSKVSSGTIWMAYDVNRKPSAQLKVSGERKGVFVVADIVKGSPSRGDSVVLHGVMNKKGAVTTVIGPDGEEKQILE